MTSRWGVWAVLVGCCTGQFLVPEETLRTGCYGFPKEDFSEENNIKFAYGSSPHVPLEVGDVLPDFTLSEISLSSLLSRKKPVVLIWGMYTCPAFQGLPSDSFPRCSYADEYGLVELYSERATFVHLVGPEPHPATPEANFDSGTVRMNYWSTIPQPRTYEERRKLAQTRVSPRLHPNSILLVDTLPDNVDDPRNSPIWCSLGQGARTALLVDPVTATLSYSQEWFDAEEMARNLDLLLLQAGDTQETN